MNRGGDNDPEESPVAFSMPASLSEYMNRCVISCGRSTVASFVDARLE